MLIPSAVRGAGRGVGRAHRTWLTAVVALSLGLLAACGSGGQQPPPPAAAPAPAPAPSSAPAAPTRTLNVVASTNVWGDIAARIAGPTAQVRSIITDPDTDPHSYEGTPADAAAIGSADLVVYNGGHYDEFVEQALEASPGAQEKSIEAYALRPDQSLENEHVWFDPGTVSAFAREVATRLGQVDPAQAPELTRRADEFAARVGQVGQQLAAIGQARPGLRAVSSEPVPFYLERAAGIADVTPEAFSQAIEEETDPPAAAVAETNQLITSRGVNVLFFNPQTESPVTQNLRTLADQATIPVVEVGETLPPGMDYIVWIESLRSSIASAVQAPQ